eukprot:m.261164 g.261164  ORF g.261164 m.261164 type:complete len:233 (+) comp19690_c0_seq1:133-831(+)
MTSVVACLAWVPRGAAKEVPDKVGLDEGELKKLVERTAADLQEAEGQAARSAVDGDDAEMDEGEDEGDEGEWETEEEDEEEEDGDDDMVDGAAGPAKDDEEFRKRYNLDDYDNDDDDEDIVDAGAGGTSIQGAGMGNGLAGLAFHASNKDDPYITLKDEDDDEEEIDDYRIRPQDNLLVVGQTEDVYSHLVVNGIVGWQPFLKLCIAALLATLDISCHHVIDSTPPPPPLLF